MSAFCLDILFDCLIKVIKLSLKDFALTNAYFVSFSEKKVILGATLKLIETPGEQSLGAGEKRGSLQVLDDEAAHGGKTSFAIG